MCPKDADRIASSVDPDQTASLEIVCVCSGLTCQSSYIVSFR